MAVGETPGQGCQNGSKNSLEFCPVNTMKVFVSFEQRFQIAKKKTNKQTGTPDARNNLPKSHFIMCHVTKYSRGFSDRHFERGEGPGDEVERLITRTSFPRGRRFSRSLARSFCSPAGSLAHRLDYQPLFGK